MCKKLLNQIPNNWERKWNFYKSCSFFKYAFYNYDNCMHYIKLLFLSLFLSCIILYKYIHNSNNTDIFILAVAQSIAFLIFAIFEVVRVKLRNEEN